MSFQPKNVTKIEHYIFVGQIKKVFQHYHYPERGDREEACIRYFIAEERRKGFLQDIYFKLYRRGKFAQMAGEKFPYEEGDWVHIKFTMKLREYQANDGNTYYENVAKVFKINRLDGPTATKVKDEDDNPFDEKIDDRLNDEFIDENNREYRANDKDY